MYNTVYNFMVKIITFFVFICLFTFKSCLCSCKGFWSLMTEKKTENEDEITLLSSGHGSNMENAVCLPSLSLIIDFPAIVLLMTRFKRIKIN